VLPITTGALTFDELLSDEFETLPGHTGDADRAANRLAAWCKSATGGDWALFRRRLRRDGHSVDHVLARFASARRTISAPHRVADEAWIRAAFAAGGGGSGAAQGDQPFGHLFLPLIHAAESRLWASLDESVADTLTPSARNCLAQKLLSDVCAVCTPVLYERFAQAPDYDKFIAEMASGGFQRLLDDKPVLLRLVASLARQWLATSREFVTRLHTDVDAIRRDILNVPHASAVAGIQGGLSDPHRGGRSVLLVQFEDGLRVLYKPKDLRIDVAWQGLVERLNARASIDLRVAHAIARDGYGWTEFVEHSGCRDQQEFASFFRRAGAWLALLHCFAVTDMHQENLIAVGDHPVPVDLETTLQAAEQGPAGNDEAKAYAAAREIISGSVMAVGLLPAYGRSADDTFFTVGGVASDWAVQRRLTWIDVNSDAMRPSIVDEADRPTTNLPHVGGRYAALAEHLGDFVSGFEEYAELLLSLTRDPDLGKLFDGFAGLPVRKVVRPTQFYSMLLHRLKDDRMMEDGVLWSVQADFLARLADWDHDLDPGWPLQRAERSALVELNVPFFVMQCDGTEVTDAAGTVIPTSATPGLQRARERVLRLDDRQIAWQVEVVRQAASSVSPSASIDDQPRELLTVDQLGTPTREQFVAEAAAVAEEIAEAAIPRGGAAAWIGLGSLATSDVSQLAVLGHDLYNGNSGIALFFAAHAKTAQCESSAERALAAVAYVRSELKSRNAAHVARLLGVGGATGMGSIVYVLTAMSRLMSDDALLADAHRAAALLTDDLIASDKRLDVVGGSAGAILSLLALYADTGADDVLKRALVCAEHLLAVDRVGPVGRRSWPGNGPNPQVLNGMSHGAAGFAYAMASVATVTGRQDFADAASECIEFQRANFDAERGDWRDFRVTEPHWRSQWCHGAVGIGLAMLGMTKRAAVHADTVLADIDQALNGATTGWPGHVDTLCCGTLGSVELCREAGWVLNHTELVELASQRLLAVLRTKAAAGDYRWNVGARRFNVGLFRGLAGVGYACLREVDDSIPNVLIWE
jgi:type 2 lantibiotic biosynthesis protein LanM